MYDGTQAAQVYAAALDFVKNRKPELEKHLTKNIGFAVSLGIQRPRIFAMLILRLMLRLA